MKNILFLILTTIFLIGCSNKYEYFNSKNDFTSKEVDNKVIADDMYNFVSSYYKPNQTTFYIHTSNLDKSFYEYLIQKFRSKGYAVTNNGDIKNLTFLSYNIKADSNMILVTYNINESKINRIYTIKDYKLVPAGEITGFNFDK
ncbi:hypothetical protein ACN09X_04775 [Aliarcobacter butzleri]|uniref:hypothetical protein n=1 Tax=Aliarcobacter butzleri TaxID=28197 RepID=UPI003AE75507